MTPLLTKLLAGGMCACAGSGLTIAAIKVTPMVLKPIMPASYVAPEPMKVGIIQPHVPKPKPLCQPQYIFGRNAVDYQGGVHTGGGTVSAPEMPTFALLGAGLLGLGLVRWKV